jgi:tetratricopeptide (TPR) repeat protein/mono/diheme cytochrome c family protein
VRPSGALPVVAAFAWVSIGRPIAERPSGADTQQAPTFTRDIAPLLFQQCASCHRPGGTAPFSLLTYPDARDRAALITAATAARRMPPWLPEPEYVRLAGERRLSAEQIAVIQRWAAAGAPEGEAADLPAAPVFPDGWQLGPPDLVVALPEYHAAAHRTDIYRNLVAPISLTEARFVSAVELRFGNSGAVHHARLMVDTTSSSRSMDAEDAEPGFAGMDMSGLGVRTNAQIPGGFFVGWTPGKIPTRGPQDMAWPLRPGTDLVLQVLLPPRPKPEVVRPLVGFYFARQPPARIPSLIMFNWKMMDIPPGKRDYVVTDSFALPVDVEALSVYPHAHYLATLMDAWARLPDGTRQGLLRIPHWDFNWQDAYQYAAPLALPAGSVITMRYVYDNSASNPHNPSRPPRRVTYGPNSTDEMGDLILQVVARTAQDRRTLERSLSWKYQLQDEVWFAEREVALGNLSALRGEYDSALVHFGTALSSRSDASVHAALAGALAASGDFTQALAHARIAVQLEPQQACGLAALALVVAQHPDPAIRNPEQAGELLAKAEAGLRGADAVTLGAVAAGYAAAGSGRRATQFWERAVSAAERTGNNALVAALQRRLEQSREPHP